MFIRIFSFLLLFLAAAVLHAQQPDVRISPPEPSDSVLPASAAVQGIARIGSRSLVAWGGTDYTADSGAIRNVLNIQMLDGLTPVGSPRIITDTAARPENIVAVQPLRDRFLLLWNDSRSGTPQAYCRVVDIDGNSSGGESVFSRGMFLGDSVIWTVPSANGYIVSWLGMGNAGTGLYHTELDKNGAIIGDAGVPLTGITGEALHYGDFPDVRFLGTTTGEYIMVFDDGRVDARRLPADLLTLPHYLSPDTSIAVLRYVGDTARTLTFYKSLFDTSVVRSTTIRTVKNSYKELGAVCRDTAGRWLVIYGRRDSHGGAPTVNTIVADRVTIDNQGNKALDTVVATLGSANSFSQPSNESTVDYKGAWLSFGCDNTTIFKAEMLFSFRSNIDPESSYSRTLFCGAVIDRFGSIRTSDISGWAYPTATSCEDRDSIWVARDTSSSATAVIVHDGNRRQVRLVAPRGLRRLNIAQESPGLLLDDDGMFICWREGVYIILGTCDIHSLRPMTPTDSFYSESSQPEHRYSSELLESSGALAIRTSTIDRFFSNREYLHTYYENLRIPSGGRWKLQAGLNLGNNTPYSTFVSGYDPNAGEWIGSWLRSVGYNPAPIRYTFRFGDSVRGSSCSIQNVVGIVPIDRTKFLLATPSVTYRMDNDTGFGIDSIAVQPGTVYQRLYGNYYLRYYFPHVNIQGMPADSLLRIEMFAIDGNAAVPIRAVEFKIPTSATTIALAQRRSDLSIAVVCGGDHGIHLTMLDNRLNVRLADTMVSAAHGRALHPNGVFRGDSLYVVWEDYRNAAADIYGNVALFPPFPALPDTVQAPGDTVHVPGDTVHLPGDSTIGPGPAIDTSTVHIARIYPSPARASLTMDFAFIPLGAIDIDLIDELGRTVMKFRGVMSRTNGGVTINIEGIHPGAYFVRVHDSRGGMAYQKIFVVN